MISSTVTSAVNPPTFADLLARHLPERLAVAPHRAEQDHEILHRAAEHGADDDPQRARQVAELRRQRRAHQRSGSGDGREMVAEDDPLVGRLEVVAVAQALGRRRPLVVERHDLGGDEPRVEAVADEIGADGRHHQPHAVDRFAALECDVGERRGSSATYRDPEQQPQVFRHGEQEYRIQETENRTLKRVSRFRAFRQPSVIMKEKESLSECWSLWWSSKRRVANVRLTSTRACSKKISSSSARRSTTTSPIW